MEEAVSARASGVFCLIFIFFLNNSWIEARGGISMADKTAASFETVSLDSAVQHVCSPEFDALVAGIQGIKINAPDVVEAVFNQGKPLTASTTRFPVCIAMQYPLKYLVKFPEPRPLIALVAVNKATGESFTANLAYSRPMKPVTIQNPPADIMEKAVKRVYYNVNLCSYIRLPAVPATYIVYATFQEYKSNVMTVKLVEKK